jgi:membrane-associated phospholipid phosphatase
MTASVRSAGIMTAVAGVDSRLAPVTGRQRSRPLVVVGLVLAGYAGYCWALGRISLDRPVVMAACAVAALAGARGRKPGQLRTLLVDWMPIALIFVAWDYARGLASLGVHTSYTLQPRMDRALTGGLPTVWLQRHLYPHGQALHWWDVFPSAVYFTHYVLSFVILAILWPHARASFRFYARRLVAVTLVALVFFALHPAAPPWLAARHHVVPHLVRATPGAFRVVHFPIAVKTFYAGAGTLNQVAAFPSLHAAYTVLPLLFFWRRATWWWRAVLVVYSLAMGFALILMGEHWLVDVLAGYVLSVVVWVAMPPLERRLRRRSAGRETHDGSDVGRGSSDDELVVAGVHHPAG